jgi:hypothetical protein
MFTSQAEQRALRAVHDGNPAAAHTAADLHAPLLALEERLAALGSALHAQDAQAVETAAAELHTALALALDRFARAARQGGVPPALRQRLAEASGQVVAQREALARATASLDRALDVLIPGAAATPALYGAAGAAERPGGLGGVHA